MITDKQVEALIAMALRPDLTKELTDAEIDQFIKDYDEGKHPLSDADKNAMATSGFRQYLRASLQLDQLRKENERLLTELAQLREDKADLDWLEKTRAVIASWPLAGGCQNYNVTTGQTTFFEATNLRDAIRAARNSAAKEGKE